MTSPFLNEAEAEAEARRLAFVRERALRDEASLMRQERERGPVLKERLKGGLKGGLRAKSKGKRKFSKKP